MLFLRLKGWTLSSLGNGEPLALTAVRPAHRVLVWPAGCEIALLQDYVCLAVLLVVIFEIVRRSDR
jgi:hypothetical protein